MRSAASSKIGLLLAAALALSGCESTVVSTRPDLPEVPKELRECFAGVVDLPAQADWDGETVARVIVRVRQSELAKTDCGRRLLALYDSLRLGLR